MKKIIVLSLMVLLVVTGLSAATVATGVLNVYGKIGAGALSFVVTQTSTALIELKTDPDVQPLGDGVKVGEWSFSGTNAAASVIYDVEYTYEGLKEGGTGAALVDYTLVIDDGVTPVAKATTEKTNFTASAGNFTTTRDVLVRLTPTGVTYVSTAPASSNLTSVVTLTLTGP